jgi:hypothetical protein
MRAEGFDGEPALITPAFAQERVEGSGETRWKREQGRGRNIVG